MGLFDTIRAELECFDCKQVKEREIRTERGLNLMETYYQGDTIEPFYFGDYWFEEEWYCEDCYHKAREKDENAKIAWHKSYIHCINGLIVEVSTERVEDRKLPDWELIHKISRERHNFRSLLLKIDNTIRNFRTRKDEEVRSPFDFGPKSVDELFDSIQEDIAEVLKGKAPGLF
ncbi:MAG: hypothetical protein JRI33_00575 [Deltaproteobacteria bacterium]|nr:hypothetical protein [Deltaproteobacteria bacterium]MBW2087259.1 hypothetical protein [Deltaproteobacteria bacterium]